MYASALWICPSQTFVGQKATWVLFCNQILTSYGLAITRSAMADYCN